MKFKNGWWSYAFLGCSSSLVSCRPQTHKVHRHFHAQKSSSLAQSVPISWYSVIQRGSISVCYSVINSNCKFPPLSTIAVLLGYWYIYYYVFLIDYVYKFTGQRLKVQFKMIPSLKNSSALKGKHSWTYSCMIDAYMIRVNNR